VAALGRVIAAKRTGATTLKVTANILAGSVRAVMVVWTQLGRVEPGRRVKPKVPRWHIHKALVIKGALMGLRKNWWV